MKAISRYWSYFKGLRKSTNLSIFLILNILSKLGDKYPYFRKKRVLRDLGWFDWLYQLQLYYLGLGQFKNIKEFIWENWKLIIHQSCFRVALNDLVKNPFYLMGNWTRKFVIHCYLFPNKNISFGIIFSWSGRVCQIVCN